MAARSALSKGLLAAAIAAAFAILMALGTWQLQRLAWKEGLIEAATARPSLPPIEAPGPKAWPAFDIEEWDYRPVTLNGEFLSSDGERREALYFIALSDASGPLGGPGYFIISPFRTDSGFTVLVNRGFIPQALEDPSVRPPTEAVPVGPVTLTGIIRPNDEATFLQPWPDPGEKTVLARDLEQLAYVVEAPEPVAPYQIDLAASHTPADGVPQAGEWRIAFTNNHLGYAITWYGIGAALVGVVGFSLLRRKRPKS